MIQIVESLCVSAELAPGTRVKTFRGSTHGVVTRVLGDGRIVWRTEGGTELIALPESLGSGMTCLGHEARHHQST